MAWTPIAIGADKMDLIKKKNYEMKYNGKQVIDFLIQPRILFILFCLIIASPEIYKDFLARPIHARALKQRGLLVKSNFDRSSIYLGKGKWIGEYSFLVLGKKYIGHPYQDCTPAEYLIPDTIEVLYLPEDPSVNRPAYELYNDYRYSWEDEIAHKKRPIFDDHLRKFIYEK